jgi:hypothetical protein
MLDLDSPDWKGLSHAYGSARDVPGMLRALRLGNGDADAWERIYGSLCHQGDVFPASFAAVPHIVAIAEERPPDQRLEFWSFVGSIAAGGSRDGKGLPDDLQTAYVKALERMVPQVYGALIARPADESEAVLAEVPGVEGVGEVRVRWIGHRLHAEAEVTVDENRSIAEAHDIAERARHALLHEVPHLASALIHADPCGHGGTDPHAELAHHAIEATPTSPKSGPEPRGVAH